jgi:hypothetical protein
MIVTYAYHVAMHLSSSQIVGHLSFARYSRTWRDAVRHARRSLIGACLLPGMVSAASVVTPEDMAFGRDILVDEDSAILTFDLPASVYRHAVDPKLRDVRVFNAAGEPVPFTIGSAPPQAAHSRSPETFPVFPLHVREQDGIRWIERLERKKDGSWLRSQAMVAGEIVRIGAWLVDLGENAARIDWLRLEWSAGETGFAARVDVRSSDDLKRWRPLATGAVVADLRSGELRLRRDRIDLRSDSERYLRIDWPESLKGVVLTGVEVGFRPERSPSPRRWLSLVGRPEAEDRRVLRFDTGGHFPVDRARLPLDGHNWARYLKLATRTGPDERWRPRAEGRIWHIEQSGLSFGSDPLSFAPVRDPLWRLRLDPLPPGRGEPPVLDLGWRPQRLTFLAEGPGPWQLAYGSRELATTSAVSGRALDRLIEEEEMPPARPVRLGPERELSGLSRLQPSGPALPWAAIGLWGVLLTGLALLLFMLRRLLRQMGS